MTEPHDIFPLDLSDFEYYACRDETVEAPMVMVLRIHIEGSLDVPAFREALRSTLWHHPLLRSVIRLDDRQMQWRLLDHHEPQLHCTCHEGEQPPMGCHPPYMDLTFEAGARFELRSCAERSVLIAYLHHACVDGIGGIRFLADVFALYGQQTAESDEERPDVQFPDPAALLQRGVVPKLGGKGKKWTEWLHGPGRFLLGRNYCIKPRSIRRTPVDESHSMLQTAVLPRSTVVQLRRCAAARRVSTNDLCMLAYLQQIAFWTQSDQSAHGNDLFRILMPVSMRTPQHDRVSAANVLSYVFQPFRRCDCSDSETLLTAIHHRSAEMINNNEGAVVLRLFAFVRQIPGLFWLSKKLQPSCATAVLANVGDLKRVFENRFPLKKGRIVAGNVVIQRIDGIAPLRKHTNVVISFGGYAGELILNLRACPGVMSADEAELFLKQVVSRLTTFAETQSLTGVHVPTHDGRADNDCLELADKPLDGSELMSVS